MDNKNECPFIGKVFECETMKMDLKSMQFEKLGPARLSLHSDRIIIKDKNGTIEKEWSFLKRDENRYFFEDEDMSQWIVGEKIISYTIVQTGKHLTFIMK